MLPTGTEATDYRSPADFILRETNSLLVPQILQGGDHGRLRRQYLDAPFMESADKFHVDSIVNRRKVLEVPILDRHLSGSQGGTLNFKAAAAYRFILTPSSSKKTLSDAITTGELQVAPP
jgi:hypothetical protein